MSSYYKPRTFRSGQGCCVCRCKSSSSRFTDSSKYEQDFQRCFHITERSGEICNACVLLVKRSRRLPPGSTKNWSHVADCRAGPGGSRSVFSRQRSRQQLREDPEVKTRKIGRQLTRLKIKPMKHHENSGEHKLQVPRVTPTPSEEEMEPTTSNGATTNTDETENPFIDHSYWKRTEVCCGIVYIGMCEELMIDAKHFHPCQTKKKSTQGSVSTRSRTDTFSSNSSNLAPVESPPHS